MKLVVKKNSLKKISEKPTGVVFVEHNGVAFPEDNWNDFAISLVTAWADCIVEVRKKNLSMASVSFMDGPFKVVIEKNGDDNWCARFEEITRKGPGVENEFEFDLSDFSTSISDALESCIEFCNSSTWGAEFVEALKYAKSVLVNS